MDTFNNRFSLPNYTKTTQLANAVSGAAAAALCAGSGDRIRLIVTSNILSDPAVGNDTILIGTGLGSQFKAIAAITAESPTAILRLEDYGEIIRVPLTQISLQAATWSIYVTSVDAVKPLV